MAQDLGRKVLAEVEEMGLDELLAAHRPLAPTPPFNLPALDRLLPTRSPQPPLLELTSAGPSPGAGKTHLLYHLLALAVLPSANGGKGGCAVIIDTDGTFSVERLAQQLRLLLLLPSKPEDPASTTASATEPAPHDENEATAKILAALSHIHLFRPQTPASTLATLQNLPTYLLTSKTHLSHDRPLTLLALDSLPRSQTTPKANNNDNNNNPTFLPTPPPQTYLTTLTTLSNTFATPSVYTTRTTTTTTTTTTPKTRPEPLTLKLRRKAVRKFPQGVSVRAALRECGQRAQIVGEGVFEVSVVIGGGQRGGGRGVEGERFGFRVGAEGVVVAPGAVDG
ncbi:hypothetical protein B0A50_02369 [Salinomyces thailandicus]|uniref:Uncharacterized protein n=1 Tax=Salinomyces thailandicus TaxID=706561 RepID=A0A4V5N5C9_9PEZI|nr:hypothetical protein B0A50_02369 [Salinomyces thailandica]